MKNLLGKTTKSLIAVTLAATAFMPAMADEKQLIEQLPTFIADAFDQLDLRHGISIAVIKGDKTVYSGAFGYADIKADIKATDDTSFYIASSTKPFTGLAAVLLAEKGKLDLNKSLAAFFPEVNFDPSLKADQITIRHLLAHTHGLNNNPIAFAAAYSGNHTPDSMLEMLKHTTGSKKAPFGTYDYTNLGYNIFSMILERELGKPWQDILAEEIFSPIEMSRTSSYMSDVQKGGWQLAKPYSFAGPDRDEALYLVKKDNTMHAAGGMIASARDLARFIQAQLSEGRVDGKQIIPAAAIRTAHTKIADFEQNRGSYNRTGYAMGWQLGTFEGESLMHHFGGFAGSSAHISFMPEHNLGLVILMNEGQVAQPLGVTIAGYVYDMMRDKEGVDTARRGEITTLAERLTGARKNIEASILSRANRKWTMSHPFALYAGTYSNPLYGTVTIIEVTPEKLEVQLGNMHAVATPYKKPNSLRLEMVPGQGEVVTFAVNETSVESLTYDGATFIRD